MKTDDRRANLIGSTFRIYEHAERYTSLVDWKHRDLLWVRGSEFQISVSFLKMSQKSNPGSGLLTTIFVAGTIHSPNSPKLQSGMNES